MPRSQSLKEAQERYYAKTREERLTKMREKTRAEWLKMTPEQKEQKRVKRIESRCARENTEKRSRVEEWLKDEGLSDGFKTFLRESVLPVIEEVPPKFLDLCWNTLTIANIKRNWTDNFKSAVVIEYAEEARSAEV